MRQREMSGADDRERGMVTAELAMTLPVVVAVLFLVLSFGLALVTQLRVADAAREAARGYAMEMADDDVRSIVADRAGAEAAIEMESSGDVITVTVTAPVGGPWSLLDLTAESSMTAFAEGRP